MNITNNQSRYDTVVSVKEYPFTRNSVSKFDLESSFLLFSIFIFMNKIYNYLEFSIYFSSQIVVFLCFVDCTGILHRSSPSLFYPPRSLKDEMTRSLSEPCCGIIIILSAPYSVMKSKVDWIHITMMSHEHQSVSNPWQIHCLYNSLFILITNKNIETLHYSPFLPI